MLKILKHKTMNKKHTSKEADSSELRKTNVRSCFSFYKSKEHPNGAVRITKENALKLKELGWEVNFHTDYYLNFIGCNFKGLEIGFSCYMENLDILLTTPAVGYYGDYWTEIISIDSEDNLNVFIDTISNLVWLSKNNH